MARRNAFTAIRPARSPLAYTGPGAPTPAEGRRRARARAACLLQRSRTSHAKHMASRGATIQRTPSSTGRSPSRRAQPHQKQKHRL